ncbi:MAG TPA: HPr family phosphocarrier protein [Hungateiclostridium thermocellum]|nr:HPr family phosphocarrier protein [Acetivibrio thermocellus]CDG34800.1 HPrNtr domain-containing protein [Acetivibrio thermocellus BC1]ADU75155.1 Phosphotransferase system, phosphocarrier protein HPr [Acetivibrio thermocellus DSM 1313]ALX09130.1 Phosphotransferase system, phosphocarrier protein HPr [Acetivibrio thermocellus AD2]ANV76882.1 Phosphotransferase system, phosphocarrier protein HPr [Acetivibrio thermocellus DSM 2360]EIC04849.1 phosphocarrier, HPr family [Acetivibrio thermocellus YS
MVEKTVVITNPEGLHARPAALFVQTAGKFTSNVWIKVGKTKVNAKSIMGLISLAVAQGTEVVIGAEGEDEEKAVEELIDLVTTGFTED